MVVLEISTHGGRIEEKEEQQQEQQVFAFDYLPREQGQLSTALALFSKKPVDAIGGSGAWPAFREGAACSFLAKEKAASFFDKRRERVVTSTSTLAIEKIQTIFFHPNSPAF